MTEEEYRAQLSTSVTLAVQAVWRIASISRGREDWFNHHFANALIRALRTAWHSDRAENVEDA